jgi:hypothetical protein
MPLVSAYFSALEIRCAKYGLDSSGPSLGLAVGSFGCGNRPSDYIKDELYG